jgi:antitoxin VapB
MSGPESSTIVTNKRGQVLRLPKAVAFPEDVRRVEIIKLGRSRLVVPAGERWDDFFLDGPQVSEDFLADRDRPGET